ncbi:MAG TPA: hypothetical protein VMC61_00180, partial [Methanocella sp.]|nr:hypothetical protein [Methanocella sp.]
RRYARTFVTYVDTTLPLRDGSFKQSFLGCAYEAFDGKGRREFISTCPTNYLSNEAGALLDSFIALGEVIEARYFDERVSDLIRELPRAPLVTTFGLDGDKPPREVSAVIERYDGHFEASAPGLPFRASADEPCGALRELERALSGDPSGARGHVLRSDPIFGSVDVQLSLKESFFVKRFLISIAPCQNGTRYYRAYGPQAGVTTKSATIEGALQNIKDAIALKYHERPVKDVERDLKARPILTTARLN